MGDHLFFNENKIYFKYINNLFNIDIDFGNILYFICSMDKI